MRILAHGWFFRGSFLQSGLGCMQNSRLTLSSSKWECRDRPLVFWWFQYSPKEIHEPDVPLAFPLLVAETLRSRKDWTNALWIQMPAMDRNQTWVTSWQGDFFSFGTWTADRGAWPTGKSTANIGPRRLNCKVGPVQLAQGQHSRCMEWRRKGKGIQVRCSLEMRKGWAIYY